MKKSYILCQSLKILYSFLLQDLNWLFIQLKKRFTPSWKIILHPHSTHAKTASSHGQYKTKQSRTKHNKCCFHWRRKTKEKFSTWCIPFPTVVNERAHHVWKHFDFSFNSAGKPQKGKHCLTCKPLLQEFLEFLKYLVALLSLSFIFQLNVIKLKNNPSLNSRFTCELNCCNIHFLLFTLQMKLTSLHLQYC